MGIRCRGICYAGLLVVQVFWLARVSPGAGVVYRFLPGNPGLSSAYVAVNVETGPFLDPRELVARGPGGWGFGAPYTAEFEGAASTLRSDSILPFGQPLGPRITVEVWFRTLDISSETVLLTNRAPAGDGFLLGLQGGIPYVEFTSGAQLFSADGQLPITAGEDHWLVATIEYDGTGTLRLRLYLDGREVQQSDDVAAISSPYSIDAPFYVGTRVEGDPVSPTEVGTLTGHVYAAIVRDYIVNPLYVSSSVPFDGSPYLGLPAYHDYPLDEFHLPMDQRIDGEPVEVRHRFFLPYANDEFIPQGTATHVEKGSNGDIELVYISYYHRTREGTIRTQRSIVAEIEAATGHVRRCFRLRGQLQYSHAGGVAFSHDAIFISSEQFLERYPIPPYEGPDGSKYLDLAPDPSGSIPVLSKASFVSAFEDTLWVGDWRPANDVEPFLYTYPLNPDGRPQASPSEIFALPRNIQGVDVFRHNGQTYVFLSRNRNSREAEILRYRREQLQRDVVATADTSVTMPFGIEDLAFSRDGTLWTNSESGTVYYQRKDFSPWATFYPFVYSVPADVVIPGGASVSVESPVRLPGFSIEGYPNPLRDSASITITVPTPQYVRVLVVDVLGRISTVLADGYIAAGKKELAWAATGAAPGVYFAVLGSASGRWVTPLVVVR